MKNYLSFVNIMFHATVVQANYGTELAQSDMKGFSITCMREFMQHKLDLRGAIVPFSLLKVIQAFKMMDPGETLEVCWSDPDTRADLFKVLPDSSYELISLEEMADEGPSYQLTLLKKQFEKPI
jgi:TusA-related sulfurtransferase